MVVYKALDNLQMKMQRGGDMALTIQERLKSLRVERGLTLELLADLRLGDDMIDLLKSGRIDTALLCELAAHPEFPANRQQEFTSLLPFLIRLYILM